MRNSLALVAAGLALASPFASAGGLIAPGVFVRIASAAALFSDG